MHLKLTINRNICTRTAVVPTSVRTYSHIKRRVSRYSISQIGGYPLPGGLLGSGGSRMADSVIVLSSALIVITTRRPCKCEVEV